MATDLLPSSALRRPPVNRCLFGRPDANEQSSLAARLKQSEREAAERFSRRWNFDVTSDSDLTDGGSFKWNKVKSASDSDIPEFYIRGYSQSSRRRALTPCAGKSLSFGGEESAFSPVHYMESSSVETFLGMAPIPSHDTGRPGLELPGEGASVYEQSSSSSSPSLPRRLSHSRLTDTWPARKRWRSLTPLGHPNKRERLDGL